MTGSYRFRFDLQKLKMTKSDYDNLIYTAIVFSDPLFLVSEISSSWLSHTQMPVPTTTGPLIEKLVAFISAGTGRSPCSCSVVLVDVGVGNVAAWL